MAVQCLISIIVPLLCSYLMTSSPATRSTRLISNSGKSGSSRNYKTTKTNSKSSSNDCSMDGTKSINCQKQRWLVVDFDGTCTETDTTTHLPNLAAALKRESPETRVSKFQELGDEYYRLYAEAKASLCHETMTLDEALDYLDKVSNGVTEKVSQSRVLEGLSTSSEDIHHAVTEQSLDLAEMARLRKGCSSVLARALASRQWQLGVLSINWCPALIQASLVSSIRHQLRDMKQKSDVETADTILLLNDKDSHENSENIDLEGIPIWSNRIDCNGVIQLAVPGAQAKKDRISLLRKQGGFVVYIGDSATDLAALVEADLGILIGDSKSVLNMAHQWKIPVAPLTECLVHAPEEARDIGNVLWTTNSWLDIEEVLGRAQLSS